jgi:hypothetical protein
MTCIIDMSLVEANFNNTQPTFQDFKTFNKSGPDIENQLAVVKEYQEAVSQRPRIAMFSRVSVLSFLPIFGTL